MNDSKLYSHSNAIIQIGDNVSINSNVQLGVTENCRIIVGDNVLIGPNTVLRASNHEFKRIDIPIREQGHREGFIEVEEDVWIGANVVILPNVKIGKGSVIGAGAVVTENIEPFSIAVGVPAKK